VNDQSPILEEDLHGFVDNRLDPDRRIAVELYLDAHPEARARVDAYAAQRQALRDALNGVVHEPLPPGLNLRRLAATRRASRPGPGWRAAAAVLLALSTGLAGGWSARGRFIPPQVGVAALSREAADNYKVYAMDSTRPVEFRASDETVLAKWVSNRLHRSVSPPNLTKAGYRLIGGRLVATPHGPAALFLYEGALSSRIALFVRPMARKVTEGLSDQSNDGLGGVAWIDRGLGYGLIGETSAQSLVPVAGEVRRQILGSTAPQEG
jgi:anti-sigma factor RsiW